MGHSALLMEKGKHGLWEFRVPKTVQAPKTKSQGITVPSRAAASACACTEPFVDSSQAESQEACGLIPRTAPLASG